MAGAGRSRLRSGGEKLREQIARNPDDFEARMDLARAALAART
jgi:thioredoxin-like negative regulator of GroEL